MKQLKETKKITLATLKSFAKRNSEKLFVKECSSFDGMTDCVENCNDNSWKETSIIDKTNYYKTGINGVYTVGDSRDYFSLYEDSEYIGIDVYNSCGNSILAVKKLTNIIN
jgi:S-adenosylmethionine/arginine decarboxylase-like enzyme